MRSTSQNDVVDVQYSMEGRTGFHFAAYRSALILRRAKSHAQPDGQMATDSDPIFSVLATKVQRNASLHSQRLCQLLDLPLPRRFSM